MRRPRRPAKSDRAGSRRSRYASDDSVEIYIEPEAGSGKYYHFMANAAGTHYEGVGMDKNWNGVLEAVATVKDGVWTLEFAIPFSTLGIKPVAGATLGFNLIRNDQSANQSQTWSELDGGGFHNPSRFGRLVLGTRAIGTVGLVLPVPQPRPNCRARNGDQ